MFINTAHLKVDKKDEKDEKDENDEKYEKDEKKEKKEKIPVIPVGRQIEENLSINGVSVKILNEKFIDKIKGDLSYNFTYRKEKNGYDLRRDYKIEPGKQYKSHFYGFEFRLMDYFPIEYLEQFCNLLWLIAFKFHESYKESWEIDFIENASYLDSVMEQIALIIKGGWNTTVAEDYFIKLEEICKKININTENFNKTNAYELLNSIYKEMIYSYNKYSFDKQKESKILNSYSVILGKLDCKKLECPNRISKDKLIGFQINQILEKETKLDKITLREDNCNTKENLKHILTKLKNRYIGFKDDVIGLKNFKTHVKINKYIQNCFINEPQDIDIENFYYYIKYVHL
jgi:hypothetical protein